MTLSPKTFNLLSIGQRGVGKTVFLAGSYAELQPDRLSSHPQPFWFECQDREVQDNLDKIIRHIHQTGLYPPATIKITSFNFDLKRQGWWGVNTLCHFRWWDVPGEACTIRNPDFQNLVLNSHGCCVFISAQALVHHQDYAESIADIFDQVVAIASLAAQHQLNYSFALILTKCDLLESGAVAQLQIEQNLQPLITRLDAVQATYQRFYSAIPIVSMEGAANLRARGAAAPLLWLLSELNKHYPFHQQSDLANGFSHNLAVGQLFPPSLRKSILLLSLASVGVLGAIVAILFASRLTPVLPDQDTASNPAVQSLAQAIEP